MPTPPETINAPVVVVEDPVVDVTAKPDKLNISVDGLNVIVASLDIADPDDELGVSKTECEKLELPALATLNVIAVVAVVAVVAVPDKLPVITPLLIVTPEIAVADATYKLPPIPTPPDTTNVPVEEEVDAVVLVNPTDPTT